jgi:hypothetical protein
MPLDALNQMAWAFISDWMNKRNAQYSLENQLKSQEGWSKYQQEGAGLETRRQLDQLQAQKEAAAFMRLLGMGDQDDPTSLRVMEIVKSMGPEFLPKGTEALRPGMEAGSTLLNQVIPQLLAGDTAGVDYAGASKAGGGIQNIIRMIETGMGRKSLQEQLPSQRANAAANLLNQLGAGPNSPAAKNQIKVDDRVFSVINKTKDDVDRLTAKFLPSGGQNATYEMVLSAVQSIMPAGSAQPAKAQDDAKKWIEKVGMEFFDELSGMVQEIYLRAARGEISDAEYRIIADAASPYKMGTMFGNTKSDIIAGLQKIEDDLAKGDPNYKPMDVMNLYETNPQMHRKVLNDVWNAMYGGQ